MWRSQKTVICDGLQLMEYVETSLRSDDLWFCKYFCMMEWARFSWIFLIQRIFSILIFCAKISIITNREMIVYNNDYQNYIINIFSVIRYVLTLLASHKVIVLKYEKV